MTTPHASPDRHDLYEACVQSPPDMVELLRAIHARRPRLLAEDFCGTAAISRAWVRLVPNGRAVGIDLSAETLNRAAERAGPLAEGVDPVLRLVHADVAEAREHADMIYVGNFSIGEIHERGRLVAYLRRARERLAADGLFICDTYGGENAFQCGEVHRTHRTPGGDRIRYTWEQREADPLSAMVVNALHFRVERAGRIQHDMPDAFVYHWRLWSVPELRDALREAGFAAVQVYDKTPDAVDSEGRLHVLPLRHGDELDPSFDVLVAARTAPDNPT